METKVTLKRVKDTKNFVLYEGTKGSAVENLYVSKEALDTPNPEEITITLS